MRERTCHVPRSRQPLRNNPKTLNQSRTREIRNQSRTRSGQAFYAGGWQPDKHVTGAPPRARREHKSPDRIYGAPMAMRPLTSVGGEEIQPLEKRRTRLLRSVAMTLRCPEKPDFDDSKPRRGSLCKAAAHPLCGKALLIYAPENGALDILVVP